MNDFKSRPQIPLEKFQLEINLTNNTPQSILAKTVYTQSTNIIESPEDWDVTVLRMQIASSELPLFIPNSVGLVTDMSITLDYGGTKFQQFINITPEQKKFGVFSIQNYLNNLNNASVLAFTALKLAFPVALSTESPRFYLNTANQLISMYVQDSYLETTVNRVKIALNYKLQQLLDLPYSNSFTIPAALGYDYELSVLSYAVLLPPAPRTGFPVALSTLAGNWIQVSQGFSSTDEWDNIKGIVFVSGRLPIVKKFLPNVVSQEQNQNTSNSSLGILIDFELQKASPFEPRHIIQYAVQSEFKMISMIGTSPINAFDLQAYYQTYDGVLREVWIANNKNMSLDILFRPKGEK